MRRGGAGLGEARQGGAGRDRAGSSSKYFIEDFKHKDSVRFCKISFPHIAIERIILTQIKSADVFRSAS